MKESKIHFIVKHQGESRYVCNFACSITPAKTTDKVEKVTCKNCLKHLTIYTGAV